MGGRMKNEPVSFGEVLRDFFRRNVNWFLAGGLALLLLQDIFGTHGVLAMDRTQKETAEIQKEIDRLDAENRQLQERVKALKTDPAAIERIAREEMGLARPGEYIFKIPAQPGSSTGVPTRPADPGKKP